MLRIPLCLGLMREVSSVFKHRADKRKYIFLIGRLFLFQNGIRAQVR
jgi:hypothetical protein